MTRLRLDKHWQTWGPFLVIGAALVADDVWNWMVP